MKTKLNAKIINFNFNRVIDLDLDIHIKEKFEKQEKWALFEIDIYSRSITETVFKIHN
jgi:hypothetical protein